MESSARQNYLTNDVMTATPQKLQLMLIEAAIRFARRARQLWQAGEDEQASEALNRAQEVVGEMLAGLNREVDADLVSKVASVYLYLFRSLMEANHERDEKKLNDALRVLETERETWRQVCQQLGSRKDPQQPATTLPRSALGPPLPHVLPDSDVVDNSSSSGFLMDA